MKLELGMVPELQLRVRDADWREAAIEGVRLLVPGLRDVPMASVEPHHVRAAFDAALGGRPDPSTGEPRRPA
jgi:hypothetical protein